MKRIQLLVFTILIVFPFAAIAGNGNKDTALRAKASQWLNNASGLRFLENKGQMFDMQHKPVPNILYEASGKGMDIYVSNTGLSYVFVNLKKYKKKNSTSPVPLKFKQHSDSVVETYCRADMQLVGATIKKENIIQEGASEDRSDYYYGGICPNGILGVHSYTKITIRNIYPGIDWVLHSGKNGLKYDFVVHPGADPNQIKLKYKWTNAPQLQTDGSVKINTPMGSITEGTPVSYTDIEGSQNTREQVQTAYSIQDSCIHFNIGNYNSAQTLTIDPKLVWATYYGNAFDYRAFDFSSMNEDGANVWITGTIDAPGYPTYNPGNGVYFQGVQPSTNEAIYILQFNIAGVLKWGTYYGGSMGGSPNSIYSDGTNVWVTGLNYSYDFPTYNPGGGTFYSDTLLGGAFILKFNTSGVRKWATLFGASEGYSIQSDGKNVWLTGAADTTYFTAYNPGGGAYTQKGKGSEAYIAKFDTAGIEKWATLYGGSNGFTSDAGFSVYSDGTNVWLAGRAFTSDFPTFNPGNGAYYQGTLNGAENIFIIKFNTAGVRKWATFYDGYMPNFYDEPFSIQSDGKNVWVTGVTASTSFPVYNPGGGAYYQGTLTSSNGNAFILQFDTSGICKWATYYSGTNISGEIGYSIESDGKSVWVSGETYSADFPTLNSGCGFNQDTLGRIGDASDVFISQFSLTGVCEWATYYGTDIEDDGSGVWSDGHNLFVAGDADYEGYPVVNPGGGAYYQPTVPDSIGYGENTFVGKFILGGISVSSGVSICRGDSTPLNVSGGTSYKWSPPSGLSATNIANPVASPTITTTYTVTAIDTGACGGTYTDSVKVTVDTFKNKNLTITGNISICKGDSTTLTANGGTIYNWSTGATTSSISITNDSATKTYTVSIRNGVCVKDTNITVAVIPLPKINLSGNHSICKGDSVRLNVSGGTSYKWSNGNTTSAYSAAINSVTTVTVTAYNSPGCSHDTSITITPDSPVLSACCDALIQAGNDTTLVAVGNAKGSYQWTPQVNCLNPLCDSAKVSPTVTTTYTVTMTDSAGCEIEQALTIVVEQPCAGFIVPNVFTPGNAGPVGINNVFYINVNNTDAWDISIYDRWGKEMFHSINPAQYWDGNTESGEQAPDGVYYYIIKATCQGNSYNKDGFLQLIR